MSVGILVLRESTKLHTSTNQPRGGGFVVDSRMFILKSFEVGFVVLTGRGKFTTKSWMWRSTYTTVHQE